NVLPAGPIGPGAVGVQETELGHHRSGVVERLRLSRGASAGAEGKSAAEGTAQSPRDAGRWSGTGDVERHPDLGREQRARQELLQGVPQGGRDGNHLRSGLSLEPADDRDLRRPDQLRRYEDGALQGQRGGYERL